jgi:hypothetical protein
MQSVEPTTQRPAPLAPCVSYGHIAFGLSEIVFDLILKHAERDLILLAYKAATDALSLIDVLLHKQMVIIDSMDLAPSASVAECREGTITAKQNLNLLAQALDDAMVVSGVLSQGGNA